MQYRNLDAVDVAKFVMAFAVIAIHAGCAIFSRSSWPDAVEWFIRLAVPFFFITSGYLIARSSATLAPAEKCASLRRRSGRVMRLFCIWLLIYLPISAAFYYFFSHYNLQEAVADYAKSVVFGGESPLAWPLWYLYSLSIVLFLCSLACRSNKTQGLLFIFFLAVMLVNSIDTNLFQQGLGRKALIGFDMLTARTLGGGVYVAAGMLLWRWQRLRGSALAGVLLLGASVGAFLLCPVVSPLLGGCGVFILASCTRLPESAVYQRLRALSMWIYYIHMIVLFPIFVLIKTSGVYPPLGQTYLYASVMSLLSALLLSTLSSMPGMKFLNRLVK